jgi:predicted dehydrogenase
MRVGVVGCGVISETYLANLSRYAGVRVVAVADLDADRAAAAARRHGVEAAPSTTALLERDDVDVVCNLTVPAAHAEVTASALAAGKHVFGEKPLAVTPTEITDALTTAAAAGLLVGCAPDTFLSPGQQLARRLLDDGRIGTPVGASVSWLSRGHESWHPGADFYYRPGAGPLFDMGPYYLTALVHLLGSVTRVSGATSTTWPTRTFQTGPRRGEQFDVDVPTHVSGVLQFESGVSATLQVSFDVTTDVTRRLEVYGTEGTLSCPDPNGFAGPVGLYTDGVRRELPVPDSGDQRGIGLADLADAAVRGRAPRADAALAFHVLEVMDALHRAGAERAVVDVASRVARPAPLAPDEEWLR